VALTLAKERPTWRITATDRSTDALAVARDNAHRLGAHANTAWLEGDLFAAVPPAARFELIVSNPPYIPDAEVDTLDRDVRDHEPRLALAGGADGLDLVRAIVENAPRWLEPSGALALEIMMGQSDEVEALLRARGFVDVSSRKDYGGIPRVVSGVWPG
jgi:release factor glutamine methyltransferase